MTPGWRLTSGLVLFLLGAALPLAGQAPEEGRLRQLSQQGERALAERRYADAERAFEQLRQISPGTAEVHAQLGLIYFQQAKFVDAVPALREALKLKPGLPNMDVLLALSLSELGQHQEALAGLEKGFRKTTDVVIRRRAGLQLQRAFTALRRDAEAVEVALQLTRLHPDDPEVLYHAGRLFANFAYLVTTKLAGVAPDSVWMHLTTGEVHESQEQYEGALRAYRRVLELDPDRPGVHFRIGRVLLARAKGSGAPAAAEAGALAEFEHEIRIDPTNANAAYEAGEICRTAGQLENARTFFERALAFYPEFEDALIGLARTLLAQGDPAAALPHLQRAITLNRDNEVTYYQLAQVQRALGHEAEQQAALQEFQRLRDRRARQEVTSPVRSEITRQQLDTKPPG